MAKKKLDYASLFTLRKDGLYAATWTDEKRKRHYLYDHDPETLYYRLQDVKSRAELKPTTFKDIAESWWDKHSERIGWQTAHSYKPSLNRLIDRYGKELVSK